MDIEIIEERENPLLERKEIIVKIGHNGSCTPTSVEIRKLLLAKLGAGDDQLILDSLKQRYGAAEATATVKIYKSRESAKEVESPYVIKKNFTEGQPKPPEKSEKPPTATEGKPVEPVEPPKTVEEKEEAPPKKEKAVEVPAKDKEKPVSVEEKKAPEKEEAPKTAGKKPKADLKPPREPSKEKKEDAPKDKKPSEKETPGKKPAKKPVKGAKEE